MDFFYSAMRANFILYSKGNFFELLSIVPSNILSKFMFLAQNIISVSVVLLDLDLKRSKK